MKKDDMIVVTGAAGFIGSNIVKLLNERGYENLVLVDDLTNGHKFKNIKSAKFSSYMDKDEFMDRIVNDSLSYDEDFLTEDEGIVSIVKCVIHMGAISSTEEWDGKKMMEANYSFTSELFRICQNYGINFIYASSASVYGNTIQEDGSRGIDPLNVYAFSKWAFDQYLVKYFTNHQEMMRNYEISNKMVGDGDYTIDEPAAMNPVVGLRFFNVYGPNEWHKEGQASPVHKFAEQAREKRAVGVFREVAHRDFVHVEDCAKVALFFVENPSMGIFDVGTGIPRTFHDVANAFGAKKPPADPKDLYHFLERGGVVLTEIPMPEKFKGHYQYYTKADLTPLRAVGYSEEFLSLEDGISKFLKEGK